MKFLVTPDSFKGSISAKRVCEIVKDAILEQNINNTVYTFPAFDGGEGSAEYLTEIFHGNQIRMPAKNATGETENSTFGMAGETAFIAVADTSGLPNAKIKDPAVTTTYGMGEQIKEAIKRGAKTVVLALGGSSTNDGGAGAATALGAKFFDKDGKTFLPTGGTLGKIEKTDVSDLEKAVKGVKFIALCDVKNPLTGKNGCSYVYGGQKGADTEEKKEELDRNMKRFEKVTAFLGKDGSEEGSGAAGGLGYFTRAFLKGELVSGADYFLDAIKFDELVKDVDYVVCGEGKFDNTSSQGKICGKIIGRAQKAGKKVVVFCGATDCETSPENTAVYVISDKNLPLKLNMERGEENLKKSAEKMMKDIVKGTF